MCQLTYSNLHDPFLNGLMVYLLGRIGSEEKHDDGCGFICTEKNKVWKSEHAAKNITNLGTIISNNITDNRPIPFHIRWASYGIEVNKQNSHPFDGKHYILMHNGTLLPRSGEEPKDKKKDSDSLKFLKTLDECKDTNPSGKFEELFNGAMANFAGKFAFIIREKDTDVDYIVRGKTAELWISDFIFDGEPKGYVINTSKDTLKKSFMEFVNIWDIFFKELCEFSEPKLLGAESIYLAEDMSISKIGKTEEVAKPEVLVTKNNNTAIAPFNRHRIYNDTTNENLILGADIKDILDKAERVFEYLRDHCMGLIDFQRMFILSDDLSLFDISKEDADKFVTYVIPKISANKKVREEIKNLLNGMYFPNEVYEKYELEYPWPVNDGEKVIKAIKEYFKGE